MQLNSLVKINKKKIRVGRGIGSGRGKTSSRGHKDRSQDQAYQLKVLREDKCLYTEGFQKEVLNQLKAMKSQS